MVKIEISVYQAVFPCLGLSLPLINSFSSLYPWVIVSPQDSWQGFGVEDGVLVDSMNGTVTSQDVQGHLVSQGCYAKHQSMKHARGVQCFQADDERIVFLYLLIASCAPEG